MSWTLDAKTLGASNTNNPQVTSHTIGANAKLLVVFVFQNNRNYGATAATWNGVSMTPIYGSSFTSDPDHGSVKIYYLINPDTGTHNLSLTNPNTVNITASIASFIPSEGSCEYDTYNQSPNQTGQNPTLTVSSVSANALMCGVVIDGYRNQTTQGANYTSCHQLDAGNWTFCSEYDLDSGSAGDIVVNFVQATSDGYGIIGVSFKEVTAGPTINLGVAQLSASGQNISLQEGPVTVQLGVAQLTASGQVITPSISNDLTINLNAAQITTSGKTIAIASVNTYYVDAIGGNDGWDGKTTGTAWQTVSKVNGATLNPGDSVLFMRDRIWGGRLQPGDSGNANFPILYGAYGDGNRPLISGTASGAAFYIPDGTIRAFIQVEHFDFLGATGSSGYVVRAQCHDLTFYDCLIHGSQNAAGFYAFVNAGGENLYNIVVSNCEVYDNYTYGVNIGSASGTYGPHDCLVTGTVAHNNGVSTSADHGIYVRHGVVIDSCTCYENASAGIKVNQQLVTDSPYHPVVKNCVCYNNYYGITVENDHSIIYNNKFYGNTSAAMNLGSEASFCEIYFNTFVNNTAGNGLIRVHSDRNTGTSVKNNIFVQDAAVYDKYLIFEASNYSLQPEVANNTFDYNTYYHNGSHTHSSYYGTSGISWDVWHDIYGADPSGTFLGDVPDFVTPYTNLHPLDGGNLKDLGITIAGYGIDADGETRSDPPTPGLYDTQGISTVTVDLNVAQLSASGQQIGISAPSPGEIQINLGVAQLTTVGNSLSIQPGTVTKQLSAAQLTTSGQVIDVQPGTATIGVDAASLVSIGQTISIQKGEVSTSLDAALLTATGQNISIQKGEVTKSLNTAQIIASGKSITISAPPTGISINLGVAQLTADGKVITAQGGAVTKNLNVAQLSANGKIISIQKGEVIKSLLAAQITADGKTLSIQKGEVIKTLNAAQLSALGEKITLSVYGAPITISLQVAQITANARPISIISAITISLDAASITTSGKQLSIVEGAVTLSLDAATLIATGKSLSVQKGEASIGLDAANISTSGKQLTVIEGAVSISLDTALLNANGQSTTIIVPTVQTINLDAALISAIVNSIIISSTGPSPAPCIPVGGGGLLRIRRKNIVLILPEDQTKKKKKEEEEILIIT